MKHSPFFNFLISLFFLTGCSINTKFDDDEYRPVGASTPSNAKTHTVTETKKVIIEDDSSISNSTRYIRPGSDKPEKVITVENKSSSKKSTQHRQQDSTSSKNIVVQTISDALNSRYGNSDIIIKISKTINIHCDTPKLINTARSDTKPSSVKQSKMTLCEYQFPEQCGAHKFSLIRNNQGKLLMFHDKVFQRNVIDTLDTNPKSRPGLWDSDDYVSSELLTVNQLIGNKKTETNNLGWIMNVNDNEKSQLGRSYLAATREASKCF